MPRIAHLVALGEPHHIVQRGNRRLPTFFRNDDYQILSGGYARVVRQASGCDLGILHDDQSIPVKASMSLRPFSKLNIFDFLPECYLLLFFHATDLDTAHRHGRFFRLRGTA